MDDQGDTEVPISKPGVAIQGGGSHLRFCCLSVIVVFTLLLFSRAEVSAQTGCDLERVGGGVDITIDGVTGDLVVAGNGLRLFRSTDGGLSYTDQWLGVDGSWPSVVFSDGVLFVAAGRWGTPSEVFVMRSFDGGQTFTDPVAAYSSTANRLVDPEVLVAQNGDVLLFLTEIVTDIEGPGYFVVRLLRSPDGGDSWLWLSDVVTGPPDVKIEDPKAIELPGGDLLLAYEYEIEDLGASRIEQMRSRDSGSTWESPTVIWDDVPGSDDEPGGYQLVEPGEIWFLASTDEDDVEGYTEAVVKRKASDDGGLTWRDKLTLISVPDQIVFGSSMGPSGHLALATVRYYTTTPRTLAVYHVDPEVPGAWACAPLVFVDGWDGGTGDRWSGTLANPIQ